METTKIMILRPFHLTVVEAIRRASAGEISGLLRLIRETEIPEGHNDIITAIGEYFYSCRDAGKWEWAPEAEKTMALLGEKLTTMKKAAQTD